MKRLIQWRPYYLQHQREVSPPHPTPPHPFTLTCAFSHFLSISALLFPLSLILSLCLSLCCSHLQEAYAGSELWQRKDKGVTICTDNDTNNVHKLLYVTHLHRCKLHSRGLIDDYLHVEINQSGNCGKPIPISSSFLLEAFT